MNAPKGDETIFAEALRLPPEKRADYLAQATRGNAELRQEVESLLANYGAGDFLEAPPASAMRQTINVSIPLTEKPGDRIGRYKLLQQIGEGGCGVVYMAEQLEPVRRRVALKIIKLGMDTKAVIARFEAERQALALMDHPNIAKVFDAGATDAPVVAGFQPGVMGEGIAGTGNRSAALPGGKMPPSPAGGTPAATLSAGRPYFVMELVRGMKITEYCDEAKLSTRARLDLFIQLCQAIQHAHHKGIIHRDLKPSNVLVSVDDGVAVLKVIDFGIAKATSGQQLTNRTLFTAFEQFIGTPAYMSPEQAMLTNADIDTRSDIYALGVLLYELLTGKTPFDAKELLAIGLDEMRRTIREKEPDRPSTRLSTLPGNELSTTAQRRSIEAPKLVSELRGDLDWIVMKALEKDRARRYETANGLAMDIQRHLKNEPVVACPPSNLYRFQKLVRRNKLVFAAAGSVVAALFIGLGAATWMFVKERAAVREQSRLRQQAQAEAAKSEQVAGFLKETLKGLGPSIAWGSDRTLLQAMLKQTAERIGRALTNQPEIAISLRLSLAETYEELGLYQPEAEVAEQALSFAESTLGKESLLAANSATQLGWAEWRLNKLDQAETHLRQGLDLRRKLLGNEHALVADSLGKLSFVLANQGRSTESEKAAREAVAVCKQVLGDEHPDVGRALAALASALRIARRSAEAEPYAREAVALHRKLLGNGHYDTTTALNKLAMVLMGQRKFAEAEDLMRESLATQRKLLGDKHPELVLSLDLLGKILSARKQAEAEAMRREALAQQRKLHGDEHPAVAESLNNLANVLFDQGKLAEAETMYRKALALLRKLHGDEHPDVSHLLHNLANVLRDQGRLAEAEAVNREALTLRKKLFGDEHRYVTQSLNHLAIVLSRQGKHREALELFLAAAEKEDFEALNNLAWLLATCSDAAIRDGSNAVTFAEKAVVATNRQEPGLLDTLAAAYAEAGEFAKAATAQREAISLCQDEKIKNDLTTRLKLYESNTPYRE